MYQPTTTSEVAAIVADTAATGRKLEIRGGGSHAGVGCPDRAGAILSTAGLTGIVDYDAAELVLTARPGTLLAEIEAAVAARGQALMFEPVGPATATIGGVIGAGLSGSRRISAGAVRDHLLGFEAVSGRGERFVAGGKVVKNVTGYDVSKLMCGAWGRLAVLTEVTLKVLPSPPERRTLVWQGLDETAAWDLMGAAMRLPADVAAAAHLPGPGGATLVRIEGFGPSVEARARLIRDAFASHGAITELAGPAAMAAWAPLAGADALIDAESVWRIGVPRKKGLAVVRGLAGLGGRWIADWAGGLIWYAPDMADPTDTANATAVRRLAADAGGHASLVRAPVEVRRIVPALHPLAPGVAALSARVRAAFDPLGLFETGRFLDVAHAD